MRGSEKVGERRIVSRFFFQAEDGIRYLVRSRGLGDVYKGQLLLRVAEDRRDQRHASRQRVASPLRQGFAEIAVGLSLIHI